VCVCVCVRVCVVSFAALWVRFPVSSGGTKFRRLVISLDDTHEA